MIAHDDALELLKQHVGEAIVVAVYGTAVDWHALRPHPLNYFSVGAMGLAASHGLGLALGRPEKRVIVLDGDGSLLMNLGSLVTIAEAAPPNLIHCVCQNGTYEANGGHPIPNRGRVDFSGFARAAGYRSVHAFDDLKNFQQQIGAVLGETGPVFVDLKVEPVGDQERDYLQLHGQAVREATKAALRPA